MRYTLNDTTAYGIYNGISESDISNYVSETAKALGLDILDYDARDIEHILNKDPELKRLAQETYTPYPIQDGWSEEYREYYRRAAADRTAPGYADIPDAVVYEKICAILEAIANEILPPRRAKAENDAREREHIMGKIESIKTSEKSIKDEGGWTMVYIHQVKMKSGTVLEYEDRNVFDFGRVINPNYPIMEGLGPGGLYTRQKDGTYVWQVFSEGQGWMPVRPLTEDETYAVLAITKYCGHHNAGIRM